jgi:para-nitrobenzyl esterase
MKKLLGMLLGAIALTAYGAAERPVIQIEAGKLQGAVEYNMHAFKNIPYAAPPVGDLRWRPPQPAESWSGIRDAGQFGDSCPQPFVKKI